MWQCRVRNKTIIGLKCTRYWYVIVLEIVRNKTIIGLKSQEAFDRCDDSKS